MVDGGDALTLLRGAQVDLRAMEAADVPVYHRWENDTEMNGSYQTPMLKSLRQVEKWFDELAGARDERGVLIVATKDGVPVGRVSYFRLVFAPYSYGYNIGISIAPEHRGHGYGAEAQRLLADYLLYAFPVRRVEASTDVENLAEQRALERAGFTREGILRSGWWRGGRWYDMVVYSRVQGDA